MNEVYHVTDISNRISHQYEADNFHQITITIDSCNTFHRMGMIAHHYHTRDRNMFLALDVPNAEN